MLRIEKYEGYRPYEEILTLQRELFHRMVEEKRAKGKVGEEHVLIVEHEPVITFGRRAAESNLLLPEETLRVRGIELFHIERGGDITYHGPGQIVVYPLLDLDAHGLGVKDYINLLEETVIMTLRDYGVRGERIEGATGVWIGKGTPGERKICAIGVKCSRFITMHGLALNVNTDLSPFKYINPCGFIDKGVTSMALELGKELNIEDVKDRLLKHFNTLIK